MAKKVLTPNRDQKDIEAQDKAQQGNNVINSQDEVDNVDELTTDEDEEVVLGDEDLAETDLEEEEDDDDIEFDEDEEDEEEEEK